jgi:glycerophosphoryl diester phosphodiesterase
LTGRATAAPGACCPKIPFPAFRKALDLGVTTLELDVVVSKDKQVVVSHEPFFSADICTDPRATPSPGATKRAEPVHLTPTPKSSVRLRLPGQPAFPGAAEAKGAQAPAARSDPQHGGLPQEKNLPPFGYNIEIKSTPAGDNVYHPAWPSSRTWCTGVITEQLSTDRFTLQCFDFRVLRYWHEKYPAVTLVALVENLRGVEKNLADLGFTPAVYSPYYQLITGKDAVEAIHRLGMKVIPWTVNDPDDMRRLKAWGVDGIITDYPDRIKGL